MQVKAYRTKKIVPHDDLIKILDESLPKLEARSVVAISSKIISLCQGDIIQKSNDIKKEDLIKKECSYFIDGRKMVENGVFLTIKDGILNATSGIDESNGQGVYILWPKNVQNICALIWEHLKAKNGIKELGIIVTDSRSSPLKLGVLGVGIAWCGFNPLFNYRGMPDIWDRKLTGTRANHLDAFAVAAVHEMGEGDEQTPVCVITDIKKAVFTDAPPSIEDIEALKIDLNKDLYSPILSSAKWEKGGS
ncbi:MAG: Coenzyme F420:L-glutamate ligase [Alphaproteobacteria bacterium ADurb.Bin438]|nr:MAG: Coenzyme F420:L-glutamate ligase [Alphaproteobacteria bacterium ADurb.Bin438]